MKKTLLPVPLLAIAVAAFAAAPERSAPAAKPPRASVTPASTSPAAGASSTSPLPPGVRVRDHIAEAATAERLRATLLENFREEALSFRIEVEEDLATITGKVRSVMTPAAVSRVARTVDGIRRVDNRLVAPTEAKVSGDAEPAREKEEISPAIHDAILTARVRAALLDARKAAALELTVTAKDGAVLLTGKAAGAAEREGALAVAKKVRGVRKATAEGVQVPPPPAPPTTSATAVPKGTK